MSVIRLGSPAVPVKIPGKGLISRNWSTSGKQREDTPNGAGFRSWKVTA